MDTLVVWVDVPCHFWNLEIWKFLSKILKFQNLKNAHLTNYGSKSRVRDLVFYTSIDSVFFKCQKISYLKFLISQKFSKTLEKSQEWP
jgi:hypothetical protein